MTRKSATITALLALHLGGECLWAQDYPQAEELWRTDGVSQGLELASVTDALLDIDGRLWILDESTPRISMWEWRDREREPHNPQALDLPGLSAPVRLRLQQDGGVAVLDVIRRAAVLLSPRGAEVREVRLSGMQFLNPKDFLVLRDGRLVILGATTQSRANVWVFSPNGSLIHSTLEGQFLGEPRTSAMVAGGVGIAIDERLVVSTTQRPGLYAVDLSSGEATLLDSLAGLFSDQGSDFVTRSSRDGQPVFSFNWFYTRPTALIPLSSERVLHAVTNFGADQTTWEVRNWDDGSLVTRFVTDRAYRPLVHAGDGVVLAMHRDPQSKRQSLVGLRLHGTF